MHGQGVQGHTKCWYIIRVTSTALQNAANAHRARALRSCKSAAAQRPVTDGYCQGAEGGHLHPPCCLEPAQRQGW